MRTILAASMVLAALAAPGRARACTCAERALPEAREDATAVFEGRVHAIVDVPADGEHPPARIVTLRVTRTWKGADAETVVVRTLATGEMCGFAFQQDRAYLVFAEGEADALRVSLCSRTRAIEQADEDLAALGVGVTPVDVRDPPPAARTEGPRPLPPGAGGCAGCAVPGRGRSSGLGPLACLAALTVLRRRRWRSP